MRDVCIHGVDGLDVVMVCMMYVYMEWITRCSYKVHGTREIARITCITTWSPSTPCIHTSRTYPMMSICIYGVDGLDVVIGCETREMYV